MSIFRKATTALVATVLGGSLIFTAPAEAHYHHRHHYHHFRHRLYGYQPVYQVMGGIRSLVTRIASEEGVPPSLAHALIRVESGYNCAARNASGAIGLGQLMPATARAMGIRNPRDCSQNLHGSMRYLHLALSRYGFTCGAVSSYNSGLGSGRCTGYGRKIFRMAYTG